MTGMAHALTKRTWVPPECEHFVQGLAAETANSDPGAVQARLAALVERNHQIHEVECVNLNPATNIMNPKAEAMLTAGLGTRASLGYPGDKYEMGLEAIEQIEVIAAELAAEVFAARYAEVRVESGALANLYAFMATCRPGDTIIAPPASIAGHVTHHAAGAAGWYGLTTVPAPVSADGYTVEVDALGRLAAEVRPALITVGGSLNLFPHPVAAIREVADSIGAKVLFDAAHACGMIAGRAWPNPLREGAHLMTMSTYKSLGGPAGGLVVTDDAELAQRLDAIAYPGLTANFDAGRTAALAVTMLDWKVAGVAYAQAMIDTASALAAALAQHGLPVFAANRGATTSHQFAVLAHSYGGGQAAAKRLRQANLLTSGIGLPVEPVADDVNGLRLGTPEVARLGMTTGDMVQLAELIAKGLEDPGDVAQDVAAWRAQFTGVHFTADAR
jgi:glycine hydroxymethyltransferase